MGDVKVRLVAGEDGTMQIVVDDSENRKDVEMEVAALMYRLLTDVAQGMNPDAKFDIKGLTFVEDPDDNPEAHQ